MHHPVKIFVIFFACSFALLYLCAGGIWSERQKSPLTLSPISESQPVTKMPMGQQNIELYEEHKLEHGHYVHYLENTRHKEFEVHCAEITPWSRDELALKKPRFLYYPHKTAADVRTPLLLELTAEQGTLHRGDPRFDILRLQNQVLVRGFDRSEKYEQEGVQISTITGEDLEIHLLQRTMATPKMVHVEHKEMLALRGEGLTGDIRQEHMVLQRQVEVTVFSALWQKERAKIAADRLISRCQGKAEVHHYRDREMVEVTQQDKVEMSGGEARLTCDRVRFWLRRKKGVQAEAGKDAWELSRIEASGNVTMIDGPNKANSDSLTMENNAESSEAVMRGNVSIHIGDIQGFTILDADSHARLLKSQRKIELRTLDVACSDRLVWRREIGKRAREVFDFWGKVSLTQSSRKIPFLRLTCGSRARLILAPPAGHDDRREPLLFKATQTVEVSHDKVDASGDTLLWKRTAADVSETLLSGSPRIKIKQLAWGEKQNPFHSFGVMDEVKRDKKPTAEAGERIEDLVVTAIAPMLLVSEDKKGANALRYSASDRVEVVRYQSGKQDRVGHLRCRRLQVKAHGGSAILDGKKQGDTQGERLELSELDADGEVQFTMPEGEGGGDRLTFQQAAGKTVTLAGKAWTQNGQGKLRGDRFHFDGGSDIFTAVGQPVTMESKEMAGHGDELNYYKKEGRLHLRGAPAEVWQNDEAGKRKHSLLAREINYWRDSGKATAEGKARLIFTSDGQQGMLGSRLTEPDAKGDDKTGVRRKQKADKAHINAPGKQKESHYQLDCEALRAQFEQQKKELQFFSAAGGVDIVELEPTDAAQKQQARGEWMVYRDRQLTLAGKPAVIHYGDNRMESHQFTFYETEKKAVCEGPALVVLPNVKSTRSDIGVGLALADKDKRGAQPTPAGKDDKPSPLRIHCQGQVHMIHGSDRILFHKEVRVEMAQGTLTCELLQVNLRDNQIDALVAHEKVCLESSGNVARADQLYWREKSGIASLTSRQTVELSARDFRLRSPVVWYDIRNRRFFTRGRDVLVEKLGEQKMPKK